MPVKDADYVIGIGTVADDSGAKQAESSLKKVGEAAEKNARKSTVDAEIQKTLAQATGKTGQEAEEAGKKQIKASEESTLSHRELREAVHGVGRAFGANIPELGLWLNNATMGLAAVLALSEGLKKYLDDLKAPIEAFNESLLAIDASRLEAAGKSASDTAAAFGEIADKESSLQSAFEQGTTALDNRIKKYDEQRAGIVRVAEAEEKAFEAELEHQSALHPEQKEANDKKKEDAKLALDLLRAQNDALKLQYEILQRTQALKAAGDRLQGPDQQSLWNAEQAAKGPADAAAVARTKAEQAAKESIAVQGGDAFVSWCIQNCTFACDQNCTYYI